MNTCKAALKSDFSIYKQRRKNLIDNIKSNFANQKGVVLLFADLEREKYKFRQESSFYYLTGIEEPSVVMAIELDGNTKLFVPKYAQNRNIWLNCPIFEASKSELNNLGIDSLEFFGSECKGYQFPCFFDVQEYENFIKYINKQIDNKNNIFTIFTSSSVSDAYFDQKFILYRLSNFINNFYLSIKDISSIIAGFRRKKSKLEIEHIKSSIKITNVAHYSAASAIKPDVFEYEVDAAINFAFNSLGAIPAFPGIVAGGINGTVLHYTQNSSKLKAGDLCVVDIGSQINYYCSDITRTYPVSGQFTKKQKEIYNIVLETQSYIASIAKPGFWLNNKLEPDRSLHHLAVKFLNLHNGYDKYFPHAVGHFLGMDVHDVGSFAQPLQEGDVITIEPGVYIPEQSLGIRIEDNYLIEKNGNFCLSQDLCKETDEIEEIMNEA